MKKKILKMSKRFALEKNIYFKKMSVDAKHEH